MTHEVTPAPDEQAADLSSCDREPIHLLGGVQGYGCLISVSSDFMVNHVSANVGDLLGLVPAKAVGLQLVDLLPEQTIHDLRTKLHMISGGAEVSRIFAYDVLGDGRRFDVSIHISDPSFVFEFEPKADTVDRDELALVQPLVARVKRSETVLGACQEATRAIAALTGFDRVMVYRFDEDGSGEVIAERKAPDAEPFLGLKYPASDIPKQARALYKRSLLRLIADVDGPVFPLVPQANPGGTPLDLSLAVTRAVSPIHLEYLRNMGVAASMSVSILKDGELWGLFACHHDTPRYVDYERRTAIELFAQFFAYELSQKIEREITKEERNARQLHDRLMIRLSAGNDLVDGFETLADELAGIVASDGLAVFSNGRYVARGAVPNEAEFLSLARFLNTVPTGEVFATDNLSAGYPDADAIADRVAGAMAVPISRTPRDYIVFFRREIAQSTTWAGNPKKPAELGPNGIRLTPRKSFAAWSELVRGTCASWTPAEQRAAEALRISLIEIVLKLAEEASLERRKAAEKQELLIAELNHRVRNILNLIRGLVSQSRADAPDITTYSEVLDGRIHALSRAHDQLTREAWAPSSLRELIEVELIAYVADRTDRFEIAGHAPMLVPEALSTLALVVHELVTNSAKYGALTNASGTISVDLTVADDGALLIAWRERGGPLVKTPTRRGFGTTIIENTIPYELKGTVETRYLLDGFEADIMIPGRFVSGVEQGAVMRPETASAPKRAVSEDTQLTGHALVVEDNLVIALDAADILNAAGAAEVHLAGSVADAIALIDAHDIRVALLDVNLGDQTSLAVAQRLAADGVPFVLATGYGDAKTTLQDFPPARLVDKPYTAETVTAELRNAISPEPC